MSSGLDVKKSEVHGMAQRGGCVTSHVRYGEKVYSPLAKKRDVDILVSFEKMDTLRYLDYLRPSSSVIVNTEELNPPSVNLGLASYPSDIIETLRRCYQNVRIVDASALACSAGDIRTVNTVLLGTLSTFLPVAIDIWENVLRASFPSKVIECNLEAFHLGMNVQ